MTNYEETIGKTQIEGHSTKQLAYTFNYVLHFRSWNCSNSFLNLNKNEPDFVRVVDTNLNSQSRIVKFIIHHEELTHQEIEIVFFFSFLNYF